MNAITTRLAWIMTCSMLLLLPGVARSAEAEHEYITSTKCKMCHRKIQYATWQETPHANALKSLEALSATEIAELGKAVGIDHATQDDCIECHVTAYDAKTKSYIEPGVACEACHGAGKDYSKLAFMKNREKSLGAGLLLPTAEVCVGCHNERSPKYKPFDFAEMRDKVHAFKNPPTD